MSKKTNKKTFEKQPKVSKNITKYVRKEIKKELKEEVELKYFVISLPGLLGGVAGTPITIDNGGLIAGPFVQPTQGLTDSSRIGDSIILKSIIHKMQLYTNPSAVLSIFPIYIRMIWFQWHSNDIPVLTQLLLTDPSSAGSSITINSFLSFDNRPLYTILSDKTISLIGPGASAGVSNEIYTDKSQTYYDKHLPLKFAKKKMQFLAGTIDSTEHIYLFMISSVSSIVAPGDKPLMNLTVQSFYTDS
jgi:hypothetical protein